MSFSTIMDSNSFTGADDAGEPLIGARTRMLGPAYRLFYERPVHLVRGQGCHLFDVDGTRYLDAYNNVASVGHCHPHVVDAVCAQLGTLNTHTRYLHRTITDYSERLLATLPAEIDRVMYGCTGSEVNDLALRVAATATGARGVVVTHDAYHGNTAAVTEVSPSLGTPLGEAVRTVAPPTDAARFAAEVSAACDDLVAAGHGVSALLVDTIFSSDGIHPDPTTLAPATEVVRRHDGLLIADEVQPGFARTGAGMWGFARHGVTPDIVTTGKPMGNGMPVAAMAARGDVLEPFARAVPYFNTFAGNPVSMAAASAVLDVIDDEGLVAHAGDVGTALRDALTGIAADTPHLGAVRGAGLYVGVDVIDPDTGAADRAGARRLVNAMRERHVLISVCGHDGETLKIRPPLVFSATDLDWFCTAFTDALG